MDMIRRNVLCLNPLRSEPAFYTKPKDRALISRSGTYVDGLLREGESEFREICRPMDDFFDTGEEEYPAYSFTGFFLEKMN